jgi:DNA topoisomerase III
VRLYICEKPAQARDIARVLGAQTRAEGCFTRSGLVVSWCIGHLLEAAPPESYGEQFKRWSIEHLPIIPNPWRVQVKRTTATQFKVLQRLLKNATDVVVATDADREGELIAREVLDLCGYRGPTQRLWLSALNDASIRKALSELRPGSETLPLYHAALARARADWLVGMNLSRLFTVLGRKAGYDGVLSVGRVQTPTLQLVVRRDREIEQFVPLPYWAIDVHLCAGEQAFTAQWIAPAECADAAGRCIRETVAQQANDRLRTSRMVQVSSVEVEHVREPAPLPFDLSTLQQECSARLGLDVQETLNIAQTLYERHKATTYPRSDCRYLPESMLAEVPQVLDALLATDPALKSLFVCLDRSQRSRAWDDGKITAHHGIIPTLEPVNLTALSGKEQAVYRLIRAHYLAQFLPAHEYDRTVAQLACADQTLTAWGKQITVVGWRVLLDESHGGPEDAGTAEVRQILPSLTAGMRCTLTSVDLKTQRTQPPKAFTQGELIKAMKGIARWVNDPRQRQKLKDTTGIGTEATRAAIIENLIARGYLLKTGRTLRASEAACTLVAAVPRAITDPGTTALWEQALDLIAARQMTLEHFMAQQAAWITQLVREHAHSTLAMALPEAPSCPLCQAPTRRRQGQQGTFFSCSRYPQCKGIAPIAATSRSTGSSRRKRSRSPRGR